jgi:hypothetical protein
MDKISSVWIIGDLKGTVLITSVWRYLQNPGSKEYFEAVYKSLGKKKTKQQYIL